MKQRVTAVIPARLGSRRFSRKVIYPFHGRPLLFYIWSSVCRSRQIERVVVATDSHEIETMVKDFGAEVVRTSRRHQTGSDRAAEAASKIGGEIIVNVQADCFGINAITLDRVIKRMKDNRQIGCGTLAARITSQKQLLDSNQVKVAVTGKGQAMWFSRLPIPYYQSAGNGRAFSQQTYLGHIGIYFFRHELLRKFAGYRRTKLEKAESLEQLRLLEHGHAIQVFRTERPTVSVDSRSDLKKLNSLYKREIQNA